MPGEARLQKGNGVIPPRMGHVHLALYAAADRMCAASKVVQLGAQRTGTCSGEPRRFIYCGAVRGLTAQSSALRLRWAQNTLTTLVGANHFSRAVPRLGSPCFPVKLSGRLWVPTHIMSNLVEPSTVVNNLPACTEVWCLGI